MDAHTSHTTTGFSLKNRENWSKNRFAWCYAILILVATILFGFLLRWAGIYETVYLRIINLFIILVGFVALMRDYKKKKNVKLGYASAFALCARTGAYFCLIFLPVLLVIFGTGHHPTSYVALRQMYGFHLTMLETVFFSYIETVGSTLTAGLLAAYISRF